MNPSYSGKTLQNQDFRGQNLAGLSFKDCVIRNTDFSKAILRGTNFTNATLEGAKFHYSDIRGANFTDAKLKNAEFQNAECGIPNYQAFSLIIISLIFTALLVLLLEILGQRTAGRIIYGFSNESPENLGESLWVAAISIFMLLAFISAIHKGLKSAFIIAGGVGILSLILSLIHVLVQLGIGFFYNHSSVSITGWIVRYLAINAIGSITGIGMGVVATALAVTIVIAKIVGGDKAVVVIKSWIWLTVIPVAVVLYQAQVVYLTIFFSIFLAFIGILLTNYISLLSIKNNDKFALVSEFAIFIASIGGTSFHNADLTDANFTSATLKNTDFRRANLIRTCWHQAKMLDFVRSGTTYLQFPQVRQLLITKNGQEQNFDRQNLRGVNFQGANLADASFITADLSEANLQDADLSRAKLVQTQLDEADLTGATLTGAYIEDWGITSHTKLNGVRCEYVFMREPTKEDPNPRRKPDNWKETFKDGDFADFIKPIVDTLDLYHNQDVDAHAIAIAFKQLAENYPEAELEIVAMEKRGGDKFLLRAATAPDANHSKLNAEYFATYNQIKALIQKEVKVSKL